jgi:hypothetical protein
VFVEGKPVGMMKIGHCLLNYPNHLSIDLLYTRESVKEVSLTIKGQTKGEDEWSRRDEHGINEYNRR